MTRPYTDTHFEDTHCSFWLDQITSGGGLENWFVQVCLRRIDFKSVLWKVCQKLVCTMKAAVIENIEMKLFASFGSPLHLWPKKDSKLVLVCSDVACFIMMYQCPFTYYIISGCSPVSNVLRLSFCFQRTACAFIGGVWIRMSLL